MFVPLMSARGGAGGKSNAVPTRSGPAAAAKAPTSSTVTRGRTSPVKGATSGRGTGRGAGTTAKVTGTVLYDIAFCRNICKHHWFYCY